MSFVMTIVSSTSPGAALYSLSPFARRGHRRAPKRFATTSAILDPGCTRDNAPHTAEG
jgi:hypothetical protein